MPRCPRPRSARRWSGSTRSGRLFPAEQARIIELLVQRIDLKPDGLELRLWLQGLGHAVQQLGVIGSDLRSAA